VSLRKLAVSTLLTIGDDPGTPDVLCTFQRGLNNRTLQTTLVAVSKQPTFVIQLHVRICESWHTVTPLVWGTEKWAINPRFKVTLEGRKDITTPVITKHLLD
jgi:hypothetical protein